MSLISAALLLSCVVALSRAQSLPRSEMRALRWLIDSSPSMAMMDSLLSTRINGKTGMLVMMNICVLTHSEAFILTLRADLSACNHAYFRLHVLVVLQQPGLRTCFLMMRLGCPASVRNVELNQYVFIICW